MSKNFRKHPLNKNFVWRQPSPPYELITREQARLYREQGGFVFYDAFDQADGCITEADDRDEENGQQAMDHLRRDIHEQTDETQCPDTSRKAFEFHR